MKRRTMLLAALAAVAGAMVLTTGASAAAHAGSAKAAPAAAATHGLVVQRGARNYAGPNCPGKGWNCTSAKRVLQVGKDNRAECTPSEAPPVVVTATQISCTIVQNGPNNQARCVERLMTDVATEDCTITQTGTSNSATIDQTVEANGGPAQTATQTANVMQTAGGGNNTLSVRQHVHQHTHVAGDQAQDIHQDLTSLQSATLSGNNSSTVKQDQNQDAHNGTSQAQNTSTSGVTPCFTSPAVDPNQCASITQTADAGNNANHLDQSIDEDMESNAASTQKQGSFAGGIDGHVELQSGTGKSTNDAKQRKSQSEKGKIAAQSQIDPMGCCSFSAQGNANSSETLNQSSAQDASSGAAAFQDLRIEGTVSSIGGTCSITQRGKNSGASSGDTVTASPCTTLELITDCEGASFGEGESPAFCETFVPDTDFARVAKR